MTNSRHFYFANNTVTDMPMPPKGRKAIIHSALTMLPRSMPRADIPYHVPPPPPHPQWCIFGGVQNIDINKQNNTTRHTQNSACVKYNSSDGVVPSSLFQREQMKYNMFGHNTEQQRNEGGVSIVIQAYTLGTT